MGSIWTKPLLASLGLVAGAQAVELRIASFNVRIGLEAPGTESFESAKSVLERVNPDVVVFQEILLEDRSGAPSFLEILASDLAYPHLFIPLRGTDFSGRVVIMSRYPFLSTQSINSPDNANDMTRAASAAVVDAPGTDKDPLLIGVHLKCCLDPEDPFRRAVEMRRVRDHLNSSGFTSQDNVIVLGDFNLIGPTISFSSQPSGLPISFRLGDDIQFPVAYESDPLFYLGDFGILNPRPRQQNGSSTWTHSSRSILDYLLVSEGLESRGFQTEIYNSTHDSSFPGLMKSGPPLASGVSRQASDHLLLFGDFELDGGIPLSLAITSSSLAEGATPATLTISIPSPLASETIITVASSDTSEAMPTSQTATIPAGSTSATLTIFPRPDSIIDGTQNLQLIATSPGFSGTNIPITVSDSDLPTYSITAFDTPVIENFEGFEGLQPPASWTIGSTSWQGVDEGALAIRGPRSYGAGSLGILTGEALTLDANFQNNTDTLLTTLTISYDAQQWRANLDGSADQLTASLLIGNQEVALPDLTFLPDTSLLTGAIAPPESMRKTAQVTGLSIPSGENFTLRFTTLPGMVGSEGSNDVFINEFHYDNSSFDEGEFVEVVLGPAFTGELSEIQLLLYNGNTGNLYETRTLDTFMPGSIDPQGYRFYYQEFDSIQNGSPGGDGLALVINGTVTQFISYEGVFIAGNGAAEGMTSVDIGVAQPGNSPAGQNSLGLIGNGSDSSDLTWSILPGNHNPGQLNPGQQLQSATQPQGIAIDNLSVIAPPATPSVILPHPIITRMNESSVNLAIPTLTGQNYQLEGSNDLNTWTPLQQRVGNNTIWSLIFPIEEARFYRVAVTRNP